MQHRAIETRYKGYRFRSRLEARWAVFFDTLGLKWEYEPEGFELSDGVRYLPDFWLPELRVWVEIKGGKPDYKALSKPRALALCGHAVVVYWGLPSISTPGETGVLYAWDEKGFSEAVGCGAICEAEQGFAFDCFHPFGEAVYSSETYEHWIPTPSRRNKIGGDLFDKTRKAVDAARGARFEHGESGVHA